MQRRLTVCIVVHHLFKGLEHPRALVTLAGHGGGKGLEPILSWYWGMSVVTFLRGVKIHTWIFNYVGVDIPTRHVVQGSTVKELMKPCVRMSDIATKKYNSFLCIYSLISRIICTEDVSLQLFSQNLHCCFDGV